MIVLFVISVFVLLKLNFVPLGIIGSKSLVYSGKRRLYFSIPMVLTKYVSSMSMSPLDNISDICSIKRKHFSKVHFSGL